MMNSVGSSFFGMNYQQNGRINTDNVFRDKELDMGFIMRANDEVAKILKQAMQEDGGRPVSEIDLTLCDSNKRCYG
jgi:hypothetical protein